MDRLGGAAGHLGTQRGEGQAGHHHHRGEREADDGERLEGDGDSDQPYGEEQGSDQATPSRDLDPLSGKANQGGEKGEGCGGGDQDDGGAGDGDPSDEREVHQHHAEQ